MDNKKKVNAKHTDSVTALWWAAWKGHPEIVKALVEKGVAEYTKWAIQNS